jgi:hypothetical protein
MKKFFLILIASFALVIAHDFKGVYAEDHHGGGGIPLSKLAGDYSGTANGSITICFEADFSATEACNTPGAVGVAFNDPAISNFTQDTAGKLLRNEHRRCVCSGRRESSGSLSRYHNRQIY